MNKELSEIRRSLSDMAEAEARKLFRLARNAQEHGVSLETVDEIKDEAWFLNLNMTSSPERLLNPFKVWKFAFK